MIMCDINKVPKSCLTGVRRGSARIKAMEKYQIAQPKFIIIIATPNGLAKGWLCHSLTESVTPLFLPELVLGAWHKPGSLV